MKKNTNIIFITLIYILPLTMGIITLFRKTEPFSFREARTNNTFAAFFKAGLNKNISTNFENALADQLIFRDRIIELNAKLEFIIGKKIINNVLINPIDGHLVSLPKYLSEEYINNNKKDLNYIKNTLGKKKIPMLYVDLPRKSDAYRRYIPDYYFKNNNIKYASDLINSKNYLNLTYPILKQGQKNYYRTDHHLNMDGIYLIYNYVVNDINKNFFNIYPSKDRKDFKVDTYEGVFIGSDGRRSTELLVSEPDSIEIYNSKENFNAKAYLYGSNKSVKVFQNNQIKGQEAYNNDYAVYIGGDTNICINNRDSLTKKKLLLIGNSYDNALVPFLSIHFSQVCHFDYRKIENIIEGDIDRIDPDLVILVYDYMAAIEKDAYKLLIRLLD